jgi:hypothetical protein
MANYKFIILFILFGLLFSISSKAQLNVLSCDDTSGLLVRDTVNGYLHGDIYTYSLADSMPDGKWIVYYDNDTSKIFITCTYVNNLRKGAYLEYDTSGQVTLKSFYSNGNELFYQFSYKGKITRECFAIGVDCEEFYERNKPCYNCRGSSAGTKGKYISLKAKRKFRRRLKQMKKDYPIEAVLEIET